MVTRVRAPRRRMCAVGHWGSAAGDGLYLLGGADTEGFDHYEKLGKNEGRIWHNELCNDDGTNRFSTCEVKHTADAYDFDLLQEPLGPEKAITFSVKAHNDAHIGFFSSEDATGHGNGAKQWNVDSVQGQEGPGYEIVLGGWGGTQSVIRGASTVHCEFVIPSAG